MSYNIPSLERQFPRLPDDVVKKGYVRLFPYYNNVKKHNSVQVSQFLRDPNLNKFLEYCSYQHDQSNIPNNLQSLKDDVTEFFGKMLGSIQDDKLRKNLFTHFLMRECNKKTIPISNQAIANTYETVFGDRIPSKIIVMVSNYCGLYYTLKSPYDYLVDTDNFDDLFDEDSIEEDSEETDTMDESTPIHDYLNPKGMKTVVGAPQLQKVLLYVAHTHFGKKPFTTEEIVTAICEDYGIDKNIWGQYLNYNKPTLVQKISSSMYQLRVEKVLEKSPKKKNKVTTKGARRVKGYLKEYEDSQFRIFKNKPLCFEESIEEIKAFDFSIADTWDKHNNDISDIVLHTHYEMNYDNSTEYAVELFFNDLCEFICQKYQIDEHIWGQYLKQNRTMFKKQVSSFKGRLIAKGFLEKIGSTSSVITQAGVDKVESWVSKSFTMAELQTTLDFVTVLSEEEKNTNSLTEEETTTLLSLSEDTQLEEDFSDTKTFTVELIDDNDTDLIESEQFQNSENNTVLGEEDNYDDYLRQVLSENDTLTEQVNDLKTSVDTFVSFLKEKDLLNEYIVSISKGTAIPF